MKVTIFLCLLYHSLSVVIYEYEITKKGYSLTMDVGQPMQRCEKSIDLAINYTWTTPIFYSPKKSSSYSEGPRINIHLIDPDTLDLYSGTIGYDYFYIRNYKMRLPFFFTKDVSIHRHYSEAFGFAFYFFDEEFSIVHHLYKKKITDDLKFSFTEQKDGKGNVYIGGTPDISSYLYKGNYTAAKEKQEADEASLERRRREQMKIRARIEANIAFQRRCGQEHNFVTIPFRGMTDDKLKLTQQDYNILRKAVNLKELQNLLTIQP